MWEEMDFQHELGPKWMHHQCTVRGEIYTVHGHCTIFNSNIHVTDSCETAPHQALNTSSSSRASQPACAHGKL